MRLPFKTTTKTVLAAFVVPVVVKTVTVTARAASARCDAGQLRLKRFRGSLRIAAYRTRTLALNVTLLASAPGACVDATFPLAYAGLAVKA